MNTLLVVTDITHIIELAVAPVFLLAGIAGFLNVMSGRLGRIVNRSRVLRELLRTSNESELLKTIHAESDILWERITVINKAIGFCTGSALSVCFLIVSLFLGGFWSLGISTLVVILFVFAMFLLIIALMFFLREVQLTTRTIRIVRNYM